MMLSNFFTLSSVVLVTQALCAFADPLLGEPTKTISYETGGWRALVRRNFERIAPRQAGDNLSLDIPAWDRNVSQACANRLQQLSTASNPAGVAVCYNVPVFDKGGWLFMSDLRLYRISKPDADWAQVGNSFNVSINYPAAMVEEGKMGNQNVTSTGPELLKAFRFLGMIQKDFQKFGASDDELMRLTVPQIAITGRKSDGSQIKTPLMTNGTSYMLGAFSTVKVPSSGTPPPVAAPFELPGTRISITPIGLYFFATYMVVGCSIVLYGTMERRKFRDQYRRRVAQSMPNPSRI